MTINYTTLLGLAKPVTGTETGQWGDVVNDSITSLLEDAVANAATISVTAGNVTLTTTNGSSNQARMSTLILTGTPGTTRNVVAPSQSKIYVVLNQSDSSVVIKGSATTGVTIISGEKAQVAWNGSDFVKIGTSGGSSTFYDVTVTNSATLSYGTANGVLYLNGSKVATSGSALTFDGSSMVLDTSTSSTALRITQTGTGNALLVEDSANPDSTPFVIDASGKEILGYTSTLTVNNYAGNPTVPARQQIATSGAATSTLQAQFANTNYAVGTITAKSRGTTVGDYTVVNNGDRLYSLNIQGADGTAFIPAADISAYVDGTPGTNDMPGRLVFSTTADGASSPTERMRIDSSGNVGIGTSSPGAKLEVAGTTSNTLVWNTTTTAANGFSARSTGGQFYFGIDDSGGGYYNTGTAYGRALYSTGAYPMVFFTNSTERARIDSSGNLGLGVTPGTWTLSGASAMQIKNAGWMGYLNNSYFTANASNAAGAWKYIANGTAALYEQVNGAHAWSTAGSGTAGNAITFTQAMTLDANGKLGIGNTSPDLTLDVYGPNGTNGDAYRVMVVLTTNTATAGIGGGIAFGGYYNGTTNKTNDFAGIQGFKENSTAGDYAGALRFTTRVNGGSPTERMRIDSSGNVGIGTSSPSTRLQVNFSSATAYSSGATGNGLLIYNTSTTNGQYAGIFFQGEPTAGNAGQASIYGTTTGSGAMDLVFSTRGSSTLAERMRLDSSGNLGIGTSSPSYKLDVSSSAEVVGRFARSAGSNALLLIQDPTTTTAPYIASYGNAMAFGRYGGGESMRLDSSGNLGIGTSSPTTRLHVSGGQVTDGGLTYNVQLSSSAAYNASPMAGDLVSLKYTSGGADAGMGGWAIGKENATDGNYASYYAMFTRANGGATTERARITSGGDFVVGKTATSVATQGFGVYSTGDFEANAGNNPAGYLNRTNDGTILSIRRSNTTVGTISVTTTATAYNTSSDYRLKENIQPMTGALAKVQALKPCTYNWKADGSEGEGFIAHELAEVAPQAVTGEKDAVDADGNPVYQGIDTSFLVATLTAAIQELKAEFDAYKATHP